MKRPKGCSNTNLHKLWASRVKEDGVCELCNIGLKGYGKLNAHHFHTKRNHSVRWWIPNGVSLCDAHHTSEKYSAHLNPAWFQQKMIEIRGEEWLESLIERTATIFPWQKHLEDILKYLKGELDDYL